MKTEPHFRIIEHQSFIACVPLYYQNADNTRTPIMADSVTNLQVVITQKGGAVVTSDQYTSRDGANNILIDFADGLPAGVYSILITGLIGDRIIRTRYNEAFECVVWNKDTTYDNFITGEMINLPASVFVLSADTGTIARIQAQLEHAIAEANAAKAEYERKAEMLDGVAQQGADPAATNTAIYNAVGNIDFSELAKQGNNPDATNTAILAAFGSIDFSTLAKQGDNANISLTTMDEKLGNMVLMSEAELQPALDDLDDMLNELD